MNPRPLTPVRPRGRPGRSRVGAAQDVGGCRSCGGLPRPQTVRSSPRFLPKIVYRGVRALSRSVVPVPHNRVRDPAPAPDNAVCQHRAGGLLSSPWRMGCGAPVWGGVAHCAVCLCVLQYLACCAWLPDGCRRGIPIGHRAGFSMVPDDSTRCRPEPGRLPRYPLARSSREATVDAACDVQECRIRDIGRSRSQQHSSPQSQRGPGPNLASLIGWASRRAGSPRPPGRPRPGPGRAPAGRVSRPSQ